MDIKMESDSFWKSPVTILVTKHVSLGLQYYKTRYFTRLCVKYGRQKTQPFS